jgi:hypothetical protein
MHRNLAVLVLVLVLALPAVAADSFYLNLLREGSSAQDRGEYEEAAVSLRLACFGLLDDPELLVEGLVRLGLAQGELQDQAGFEATFRQLLDAEERLGAYSRATPRRDLVARYEEQLLAYLPPSALEDSGIFAHLAEKARMEGLEGLSTRDRRARLQGLAQDEEDNALWPLLLADLEAREGREKEARSWADEALKRDSGRADAYCFLGWAAAEDKEYSQAREDLGRCPRRESDAFFAAAYLAALSELELWSQAAAVIHRLPEAVLADPVVAKLAGRVGKQAAALQVSEEDAAADVDPSAEAPNGEQLAQGRKLLREARTTRELDQVWALASDLVRDYPNWSEAQKLAGEVAYRASLWDEAALHLSRAGDLSESPHLLFYYAVSLYESGRREEAKEPARLCRDQIRRTDFVDNYLQRILGPAQD